MAHHGMGNVNDSISYERRCQHSASFVLVRLPTMGVS
jgi:hypothetical protein